MSRVDFVSALPPFPIDMAQVAECLKRRVIGLFVFKEIKPGLLYSDCRHRHQGTRNW